MERVSVVQVIPLNVPNSLTILRIFLVPVFVGLLIYELYHHALIVLLIAALTDGLDGTIARIANQRTRIGAYLDPLADKILLMSAFITLSVLHLVPVWAVILVVSRDAMLLTGTLIARMTESPIDLSPTVLGKLTTMAQLLYIMMVMLVATEYIPAPAIEPMQLVMVVATVLSGSHYLYRGIINLNGHAS